MSEFQRETDDSIGSHSAHPSFAQLEQSFAALATPPQDFGRLMLIVCRRGPGIHEALDRVCLTPDGGVPDDQWNRRVPLNPEAQLTLIRSDVAELVSNGQPLTTSGDNLIVDFDISAANLPVGTRLLIGEAVVEVTSKPHTGCYKFAKRFGENALRFVQSTATRHLNLRGIYCRVVKAGDVSVGAQIRVLPRSS